MAVFGYSEIFAPPPKRIMWGQLRIIQGGHLKIRGTGKNSNMRGHTKFSWGVGKNKGGKAFRDLLQSGVG